MEPTNHLVTPLLTDLYQLSMAYAYFHNNSHEKPASFDLFFRKNPFKGEFTLFAGLDEVLRFVSSFHFTADQIAYVKTIMPDNANPAFFDWLANLDCSQITVNAIAEGSVVQPRVPLIHVQGPLGICQLLETTLLNLVNYASLICTNAARMKLAAGPGKTCLEFGCRRAQGPDGAMSAAHYSYLAGFTGSSLVQAGQFWGMQISGTHAHSFVTSFHGMEDLNVRKLKSADGKDEVDFVEFVLKIRKELGHTNTNDGELAAFCSYALAYPSATLCLVDTYDTLASGVPNYLTVAVALWRLGYQARGIRLDSGDLAYLSRESRNAFVAVGKKVNAPEWFAKMTIAASNDLNEETIMALNQQGHEIDAFGIGTNLVTCQAQPALGCVYKLVEIGGKPCIKLSNEPIKVTLPGAKDAYRLYTKKYGPYVDVMTIKGYPAPQAGQRFLCRHPYNELVQVYVTPSRVVRLLDVWWEGGKLMKPLPSLSEMRIHCAEELASLRPDHIRLHNPTPYKVSVSNDLYVRMHSMWASACAIPEVE